MSRKCQQLLLLTSTIHDGKDQDPPARLGSPHGEMMLLLKHARGIRALWRFSKVKAKYDNG